MRKEIIDTDKATKPTAWYSQAVRQGNLVFLAGACGDDPVTGEIVGDGDIKIEAKAALENIKHTIEAAGGTLENIVKMQVYVKDLNMLADFNEIYKTYFPENPPARIAMAVKDFMGGANLEIDGIAVLD
ncbi:Rid family detoxifying hydrolase [Anaerotignum propionicum]|uniref:RidA family protein n=1 Tax=Anaerotignum propionicum TaxID=28446 RepID=UPI00289957FB|nr:Rid family detoxifying hydrolase [Anaerotignum propionicum]